MNQRKPIVIYDLECVLCNFWVKRLLRFDRKGRLMFAYEGSAFVKEIKGQYPDIDPADGVLLWDADRVYQGMDAVLRIAMVVGGVFRIASVMRLLPATWRTRLYNWVARNRYGWFGKRDPVCDSAMNQFSGRFIQ